MFRSALRVTKSDGKNGSADQSPEIALSLREELATGAQAGTWLGSLLQGCSLLYPHSRLVVDLARVPSPDADLLGIIEHHRNRVEARGGSLRVALPPESRVRF